MPVHYIKQLSFLFTSHLRQEKVPNIAPAAMPTAKPIMKPIFTRSKQLGWAWPYGPTDTGIWREQNMGCLKQALPGRDSISEHRHLFI